MAIGRAAVKAEVARTKDIVGLEAVGTERSCSFRDRRIAIIPTRL
jgi:hypothetical protein